ncbi:MAG: glycosyltransferase family 4 protein [Pseudomonadota bacterium]
MNNAALFYHPDGYRTDGKKLMGRQAAGESFLRGYLAYAEADTIYAYCPGGRHYHDFKNFCATHDRQPTPRQIDGIIGHDLSRLAQVGTLFNPGPTIEEFAWKRRRGAVTDFSLTGVTHTTASAGAMEHLTKLCTIPAESWDAVICTSTFVRKTVDRLIDGYLAYLQEHMGVSADWRPPIQLPVIPLGIFADDIDKPAAERNQHRARLRQQFGIADHDIAVLFVGRLSFHAKANPLPMLLALEATAKRLAGRAKVHLIQAGWFANDAIAQVFKDSEQSLAPSVVHHQPNGRDSDIRFNIWHAADIFCSLADNIQETFGLTPVEAMAAGLPVVVSDWDGYRDTIVHGETGIRVATAIPPREAGTIMARRYEDDHINYDQYCAETSMSTMVDIRQTTEAFIALAENPGLRQKMGDAGRARARALYDWRQVVPQYQELWGELTARREAAATAAGANQNTQKTTLISNPFRQNPFDLFAEYPTSQLTMESRLYPGELHPSTLKVLAQNLMINLSGNRYVGATDLAQKIYEKVNTAGVEGLGIPELLALIPEDDHARVPSTIGWLLKISGVAPDPSLRQIGEATTGPATPKSEAGAEAKTEADAP